MNTSYHPLVTTWGKTKVVWIDSDDPDMGLRLLRSKDADGIGISPYNGFKGNDISLLLSIPDLTALVIPYPMEYDLTLTKGLKKLKLLVLGKERSAFDFSVFPNLLELSTDWKPSDILPSSQSGLERLSLWGFAPKSHDLRSLPIYKNLIYLKLVQGSVENLAGIERFPLIKHAEFSHLRNLNSISAIEACDVEILDIDSCRKIKDFNSLAKCEKLRILHFTNCGKLPSLSPLKDFKALESFRFVETNVLDGDMSPLLRLNSAGFIMKRHYSHTPEQIAAAIGDVTFFKTGESLRNRVVKIT